MRTFDDADIARVIDGGALTRGRQAHAGGLVVDVDVNAEGTTIVSHVRGTQPRPYQQLITLRPGKNGTIIHGTCSCPVHVNCKHVAAALIEVLRLKPPANSPQGHECPPATENGHTPRSLSAGLTNWLAGIETAAGAKPNDDYPAELKQRLIYVLEMGATGQAVISPMVASLLKGGDFGMSPKPYSLANIDTYQPAKHLRALDHEILRELSWILRRARHPQDHRAVLPADPIATHILYKILATGRCRYNSVHGPVLSEGPTRQAVPQWKRTTSGRQRLTFELTEAEGEQHVLDAVILLEPPHYVDVAARLVGPLASGLPDRLAMQLVSAPEVTGAEAALFSTALDRRLESAGLTGRVPLPMPAMKTATRRITPTPKLELFLADVKIKQQFVWYHQDDRHRGTFKLPLARLSFDYGGQAVALQTAGNELEVIEQDQLIVIPRDHKAELAAAERASQFALKGLKDTPLDVPAPHAGDLFLALNPGPGRTGVHDFLARFDDPARFLAFSAQTLPRLAGEGWQIAYSDDYPYRLAEGEAVWWADIGEGSGIDWFSFELGVEFEGHRLNLIPHLTEALAHLPADLVELALSPDPKDQRGFVKSLQSLRLYHSLPNGRLLPLPGERLAPILRSLLHLIGPRGSRLVDGKVKLHRAEAGAIADFAGTVGSNIAWAASAERLIALGNDLRRGRTLKAVSPPKSFRAELRPYQSEGLAWLDFLRETGFGGVLADDMGLGKTVQALAFLAREKAQGRLNRPALILAPTSVLPNWQAEAERFAPELSLLALCRGSERKHLLAQITKHDLVLTTYPLLMRDADILLGHEFHAAILDEAQAIKNPKAAVSGMAHRLNARHRFALTGTPLENNLGEVWSLFQFLSPGLLGDESSFRRNFRTPIEKHGDAAAQAFLSRRLKPFMLRRTKQEVATELPPKIEIVEHVRLDGGQRDLYETVRSLMHKKVRDEIEKKGLAKSHIIFLDALLKLRQVCCDPRLLKMPQARAVKRSAKLERLMEMIPEMVAEGRRILLFSQFTSMLALIEAELVKRGIPYVTLTGDTADRAVPVKAFQSGKVPLFLLSLKAGGTGLNLTAADTVIHFDPWWNPAVENQATDRAYRIGQDKPVFVYKLIVEEGIETAIELLKLRKAALADALFAGTSKSGLNLTEADISALFAPLDQHQRDLAA